MTLTEFLLARITEDEEAARALVNNGSSNSPGERFERGLGVRMLAEVDAKRKIIALHVPGDIYADICDECGDGYFGAEYPCDTLRALSAVYADHPDYPA